MSTATDEAVDLDIDLEADVPCEMRNCSTAATWRISRPCCNAAVNACAPHRWACEAEWRRRELLAALIRASLKCAHCGETPAKPCIYRPI